ncbi:VOC family protein [Chelatococcus reniformis]|uniref:Glyoxalase n=1 Tax=Chelatococcus reniformis TaxID=1494448 RepID=A0A916TXC2_9HYPH|nr:VOC family protein [Chelatococcus reniformis]GGC49668.1 glyoxalase [Chelatococcus reniformis]
MSDSQGHFVWYELMTTDRAAAEAFYRKVVGWDAQPAANSEVPYGLLKVADTPVAGVMDLPEEARAMGTPPGWIAYVGADDVDAMTAKVERLGGTVHVQPRDIPGVGRFSMVADPQGGVLGLFKWASPMPSQPATVGTPGQIGWHELMATDWPKALAFYGELFGWTKSTPVDMGPMGTYQLFQIAGADAGGMFNMPEGVPRPFWLYYFNVDDVGAAAARVTDSGGQIVNGPMEVPGGGWILQGSDPQGAMFALSGPKAS